MVTSVFLAAAPAAELHVDSALVASDYQNGDFDKINTELRPILTPGTVCPRSDSILAWKYLAVVYAAAPATREKGSYCMLRLLDLDANADLLDMFASEEVNDQFERARQEHSLSSYAEAQPASKSESVPAPALADSIPAPAAADTGAVALEDLHPRKWMVSALAAVAVAGMAWYSWENSPDRDKIYHVSEP